jgi:hypothetical protein
MRFMLIVKSDQKSEAGALPSEKELIAMGKFNDEMIKAGIMLTAEGLLASSKGARVTFSGGKPTVKDGPFSEAKELVGGFWVIQVKSKAEAVAWASRVPFERGEIEVRQVSEAADFEPVIKTEAGRQVLAAEAAFQIKQTKA